MAKKRKRKPFYNVNPEQEQFIRANYGKLSRAAVSRKTGVPLNELDAFLRKHFIKSDWAPEAKTKDLTQWQRVPVPGIGNPVLLIPPGRDPEQARKKYLERQERKGKNE